MLLASSEAAELITVAQDYAHLEKVKAQLRALLKRSPSISEWARAAGVVDPR